MQPFETDEKRVIGEAAAESDTSPSKERFTVEPWLPHQYKWGDVTMLGLIVGILAAFITYKTGSVFLPFGISAATLLFLNCGVANIPVTYHISLIASTAIVACTGGTYHESSLFSMLALGGFSGIISALFGELTQRIYYAHSDTHLDPPATAIVLGTFLIAVLAMSGIFSSSAWIPLPWGKHVYL